MFKGFDSTEEMFAYITEGVKQAKSRATDEQNAITYGDYWMRYWPEGDLYIFGYIIPPDELYASSAYEGVSKKEIEWEKQAAEENYQNGFRFGRAYSVVEPDGELGDTHVSDMSKITKEEFEFAKSYHWQAEMFLDENGEFLIGLVVGPPIVHWPDDIWNKE